MKRARALLWLTAIVSSILGGLAVYLALTVPNDLKADALLKQARQDLAAGKGELAGDALAQVVRKYPRTDAAAAATVALVRLGQQERDALAAELARIKTVNDQQARGLAEVQKQVQVIRSTPPPVPPVVTPAPAPAPKKTTTKKPPTKRRR